jgi:Protein of unknown function (DUF1552)
MRQKMNRRVFLKGAGISIALPLLGSRGHSLRADGGPGNLRRRMVLIDFGLGLHAQNLFPKKSGFDYESTPYLDVLKDFRSNLTVISGVSHPDVDGGHLARKSFLTGAPKPLSPSFKNSISVDQVAAEQLGNETRFRSLALTLTPQSGLSFSRSGVEVPAESRPSQVFAKLFLDGNAKEKQKRIQQLRDGRSVMDSVLDQARSMRNRLGTKEAETLDQYLTAVRETEQSLVKAAAWDFKKKPFVDVSAPQDINNPADIVGRERLMYQMMHLAIQTDSTRVISFYNPGINAVPLISGVTQDYHNLSHHGQDPSRLAELKIIELEQLKLFAEFLEKLAATKEEGKSLLESTMVMLGSDLGNASSHDNHNLPIILAGGGFRHGRHLAFDQRQNYPLANLFVLMLQRLGLEIEKFASSTGTMSGIDGD